MSTPSTTVLVSVFDDDGRCIGFVLSLYRHRRAIGRHLRDTAPSRKRLLIKEAA